MLSIRRDMSFIVKILKSFDNQSYSIVGNFFRSFGTQMNEKRSYSASSNKEKVITFK